MSNFIATLEAQSVEQILNSRCVLSTIEVPLLKQLLNFLACIGALCGILHDGGVDNGTDIDVGDGVTGRHDVVVVDELDEGLDAGPAQEEKPI